MKGDREERHRAERARARKQMGGMYVRREAAKPAAYCVCGARVDSVKEVLLCEHGKREA